MKDPKIEEELLEDFEENKEEGFEYLLDRLDTLEKLYVSLILELDDVRKYIWEGESNETTLEDKIKRKFTDPRNVVVSEKGRTLTEYLINAAQSFYIADPLSKEEEQFWRLMDLSQKELLRYIGELEKAAGINTSNKRKIQIETPLDKSED